MKSLLTFAVLGLFTAGMMGCSASAEVGDPDDSNADKTYKRTETVSPDGDRTIKTETKVDR